MGTVERICRNCMYHENIDENTILCENTLDVLPDTNSCENFDNNDEIWEIDCDE